MWKGCDVGPNELVFPFGGTYVCANFGENRSRNATVRVLADGQTQTGFCNLPHATSVYAIAMVKITRNSSGDEIANVNFLYDDIVHALKCNRLLQKFRHRSLSATQVYEIQ